LTSIDDRKYDAIMITAAATAAAAAAASTDKNGEDCADDSLQYARSFEGHCASRHNEPVIDQTRSRGGRTREEAGLLTVCSNYNSVLAASARERRSNYAGLPHKCHRLLAVRAAGMGGEGEAGQERQRVSVSVAPHCYYSFSGGLPAYAPGG
jgi:hypothetical protein